MVLKHVTGRAHKNEKAYRNDVDHPWDQELRKHVYNVHMSTIAVIFNKHLPSYDAALFVWGVYREAVAVRERENGPV